MKCKLESLAPVRERESYILLESVREANVICVVNKKSRVVKNKNTTLFCI